MVGRILIVDDERLTRETLAVELGDEGFEVVTAPNPYQALEQLDQGEFDLVLTDLRMPSMDGLEFQRALRSRSPDTEVIFMTAFGSVASAVQAMREGAADYLSKPLDTEELVIRVRRLIERRRDLVEIRKLRADASSPKAIPEVVHRSSVMAAVLERAMAVADSEATVLIQGETGTGKEVVARALHAHSARSRGPLVALNCAGLNPNLVESELFGHEAGAFTGALRQRKGRIETAAGGTLFLDEVDDLAPEVQVRLLRFLQEHTFERVGGNRSWPIDVRVVCATKKPLLELVQAGKFREDLYFRINTVPLLLPPLRERLEDVVPLAEHFLAKFWRARGYSCRPELLPDTLRILLAHPWPGNVRELEHAIEHAVTFAKEAPLAPSHLPPNLLAPSEKKPVALLLSGHTSLVYDEVIAECERQLIEWALRRSEGSQVQAAELLGMPRTTFRSRCDALRRNRG